MPDLQEMLDPNSLRTPRANGQQWGSLDERLCGKGYAALPWVDCCCSFGGDNEFDFSTQFETS